jgi:uroporphyrinogen decarboxylase
MRSRSSIAGAASSRPGTFASTRSGTDQVRRRVGDGVALQGNLDPGALFASPAEIRARVADILERAGKIGHIFNLGHGVLPETNPEHVRAMVTAVKELSARG